MLTLLLFMIAEKAPIGLFLVMFGLMSWRGGRGWSWSCLSGQREERGVERSRVLSLGAPEKLMRLGPIRARLAISSQTTKLHLANLTLLQHPHHGDSNSHAAAIELLEVDTTAFEAAEGGDEIIDHISQAGAPFKASSSTTTTSRSNC